MSTTSTTSTTAAEPVHITRVMWWFGAVSTAVSAGAAIQLLVLTARTADLFAWTIAVGASAAFLGSFYLAAVVMGVLALRQPHWAPARAALVPVVAFVVLVLVVTLVHLSAFHLTTGSATGRAAGWAWLVVYLVTPPGYAFAFWWQSRAHGTAMPVTSPLWAPARAALTLTAVVLAVVALVLLLAPDVAAAWWPWPLTALTARMSGATVAGMALLAASIVRVGDRATARFAATGLAVVAGVATLVLPTYGATAVDWTGPSPWVYLAIGLAVTVAAAAAVTRPGGGRHPGPSS